MIGSIYTEVTRDAWTTVPGRSSALEYNENNKVTKITYYDGNNVAFAKNFTYDANGNCILITCTTS